jgi:hypothetical protein
MISHASFAFSNDAHSVTFVFPKHIKWQYPPASGTNSFMPFLSLTDTDKNFGIVLYYFPVHPPNTKPTIININGFFDCITDEINKVNCVKSVIRLLNKNIDPNFILIEINTTSFSS